jgi:hypothetical protein
LAPPFSIWGFSHPFYPPHALILLYPWMPISCSLVWCTRVTIPPSGLLHAFGAWSFDAPLCTTLPSLRVWTLVRAVLPFLCLPISNIFYFYSFPFPLRYLYVFPFPAEPPGLVRVICRLLYSLLCFALLYLSLSLLLLLWDATHTNEVE